MMTATMKSKLRYDPQVPKGEFAKIENKNKPHLQPTQLPSENTLGGTPRGCQDLQWPVVLN